MDTKYVAWLGAAVVAVSSLSASLVGAQEPGGPTPPPPGEFGQHPDGPPWHEPGGPPPFKMVDTNKDGTVSEEEFNAFVERRRDDHGPRWEGGPPPPGGPDPRYDERRGPPPGGPDRRFDDRQGPPPGGFDRRYDDRQGPPQGGPEHRFGDRPQGPPPGGFERGGRRDGQFEPGPPPDPRYRPEPPGGFRDGGPGRPGGPERPWPPQGPPRPPRFEEIDANGDGNITKPEFEAFHESRRPPRPE